MSISDLQIDTSIAPAKNMTDNRESNLQGLRDRKPFYELLQFIESVIGTQSTSLYCGEDNALFLNELCVSIHGSMNGSVRCSLPIAFSDQGLFDDDKRYYEQIIFEDKNVPTRPNWHDFFNGIIWCQFPKTKHYFNAQHMAEITSHGSTYRTPARDRLTHFDECGIVLFTTQKKVAGLVKNHQWGDLFVNNTANWHQQTIPLIFGHALWEMLLAPFIGLTAKATVIEVSDDEMTSMQSHLYTAEFFAKCDEILCEHIKTKQLIATKKPWLPLPLLGIPQWSPFPQTQAFYDNQQYFMPKTL